MSTQDPTNPTFVPTGQPNLIYAKAIRARVAEQPSTEAKHAQISFETTRMSYEILRELHIIRLILLWMLVIVPGIALLAAVFVR
jgi:hypothetical protein